VDIEINRRVRTIGHVVGADDIDGYLVELELAVLYREIRRHGLREAFRYKSVPRLDIAKPSRDVGKIVRWFVVTERSGG
jgi:hypothetical protein